MTNTKPALTLTNLTLHTAHSPRPILDAISYTVHPGDFVIILGSNGSGKSSLLKTINKTYTHAQGAITLNNKNIHDIPAPQFAQKIATVTQDSADSLFSGFTVFENALMYQTKKHTRDFYIRYLSEFSDDLPQKLDVPIERLSGGQRQTLILALCLHNNPDILLLDEHTSALDPKTGETVMRKTYDHVRASKTTCLMTTHDLDEALAYGDRLIALKNGQIVFAADGAEKQKLTKDMLLKLCY